MTNTYPYPIRSAPEIARTLLDYVIGVTPQITDLTEGSVLRTILESVAVEFARQEVATAVAQNNAIQQASYRTFGFARQDAEPATGQVLFTITPGQTGTITIPAGTRVSVPGSPSKIYETTVDVSAVLTGSPADPTTITAPIVALQPGVISNTQAQTITQISGSAVGVASVTNPLGLFNGHDIETEAERRVRFSEFILSLQRATESAILAGAKSTRIYDPYGYVLDAVRKASTVENDPTIPNAASLAPLVANPDNPPPGTIYVYIHNGVSTPSQQLIAACEKVINGWEDTSTTPSTLYPGFKAAAITAVVFPAVEVSVNVQIVYDIVPGYVPEIVTPAITTAVQQYLGSLDIGETMRVQMLQRAVAVIPGVLDFQLLTPTTNYQSSIKELPLLGTLSVVQNA